MSFAIGGGIVLILAAGVLFTHTLRNPKSDETSIEPIVAEEPFSEDISDLNEEEWMSRMKTMSANEYTLNHPRSDIGVDSLTGKIPSGFANVDPQRHRNPSKNPKDEDGDASWVTALGQAVELEMLQQDSNLINSIRATLRESRTGLLNSNQ